MNFKVLASRSLPTSDLTPPQTALRIVSKQVFNRLIVPDWLLKLGPTKTIRDMRTAFDELEVRALQDIENSSDANYWQTYMLEMIKARRQAEKKEERYDLFSSLLDANEEELEEGQIRLFDSELIGM